MTEQVGDDAGDAPGALVEIRPALPWYSLGLGEVWSRRELLGILALRDLSVRHKQTMLGPGWAVLQPLLSTFAFTMLFGVLARVPSRGVPYHLLVLVGIVPWSYFSQAVSRAGYSLVSHAHLITKVYFPRLLLPLSSVLSPLADLGIGLVILMLLIAPSGIGLSWRLAVLPVFIFLAVLAGVTVGLWVSVLNVRYRDLGHALPFLLQVWMYATPVAYPLELVPARWRPLYDLNPMVGVVQGFRWAILGSPGPDLGRLAFSLGGVLVLLIGGLVLFRKEEDAMADLI